MIKINTKELNLMTPVKQQIRGLFRVSSGDGSRFHALIFTSHPRIVTDVDEFTGREVTIRYGIDVTGLAEGDEIDGTITIASDEGEFSIPVHVMIELPEFAGDGIVRSLDDFTELAMHDFDEALRQFRSPLFEELVLRDAPEHLALFRGLHVHPLTAQKLEEFLVLTGRKSAVEVSIMKTKAEYYHLTDSTQESVLLKRNTWGAVELRAECDADFIELPRPVVRSDDFVGSAADLVYVVRADRLGERTRIAEIRITGGSRTLVLEVTASKNPKNSRRETFRVKEKQLEAAEQYLQYLRSGRTDTDALVGARFRLEELKGIPKVNAWARLWEAWLRHETGDIKERNLLIHGLGEDSFDRDQYLERTVYFYLSGEAGIISPEKGRISERIERQFLKHPDNVMLMKLYFLTSPEAGRLPVLRLQTMQRVFRSGCTSPFLYEEALQLLLTDESQLTTIDDFTRQVLYYAAKQDALTEELALRAAFLSDNEKHFTEVMYRILALAYERYPYDGILEAVVRLLMKGPSHDSRCFHWYAQAVEKHIRITRLYEYYIETIPESRQNILPLPIRKYFIYNDTLSDQNRAYVYANITRNRLEDPDTFESYRDKISAFTAQSLVRHHMNADYAALYQEFIHTVPESEADDLAKMVFTAQIFCDDASARSAVVVHPELSEEEVVPLLHGTALVHLYTRDAQILFEDAAQRRFRSSAAYSVEQLMDADSYIEELTGAGSREEGFVLHLLAGNEVTPENRDLWKFVSESESFTDEFRLDARRKLLADYAQHPDDAYVADAVRLLDDESYAEADKVGLVEVLLAHGEYDRAFELISVYGAEGVEDSQLVRLISRMIEEMDGEQDEELVLLAAQAFQRGKFDERILSYLVHHFSGSIEDMLKVRRAAENFYIETYPIDEVLIFRSVFSGVYLEDGSRILRHYVEKGSRRNLVLSYVKIAAEHLFELDQIPDEYLAKTIREFADQDRADLLMKLMLLRFDAELTELTPAVENEIDALLEEFVRQDLRFAFFQKFPLSLIRPYQLEDKVFAEIRANEGDRVTLYYRISSGSENADGAYRREPMKMIYRGIYQKIFTLFYGEQLTYYIEVVHDDTTHKTEETTVTSPFVDLTGRSRYQLINRMLKAEEDNEQELLESMIGDYLKTQHVMRTLFNMEEEN